MLTKDVSKIYLGGVRFDKSGIGSQAVITKMYDAVMYDGGGYHKFMPNDKAIIGGVSVYDNGDKNYILKVGDDYYSVPSNCCTLTGGYSVKLKLLPFLVRKVAIMAIANGKNVNVIYLGGEKFQKIWTATKVKIPKGTTIHYQSDDDATKKLPKDYYGTIDEQISRVNAPGVTSSLKDTFVHVKADGIADAYYNIDELIPLSSTNTGGYSNTLFYVLPPRKAVA